MTTKTDTSSSADPEAFVKKEQQDILEKLGLWDGCSRITDKPVKNDPLNLLVSTIRTTEVTGGPMGTYKVEALRNCFPVVSFQWTYMIRGDNEFWKVRATRSDDCGSVFAGEITYDANGTCTDCLSRDNAFVRTFVWLFKDEQTATPFWLGEPFFTLGGRWKLITKNSCPACDSGPFCNC